MSETYPGYTNDSLPEDDDFEDYTKDPHYKWEEAYGSLTAGQTYKYLDENNQVEELTVLFIERPPLCIDDEIETTKMKLLRYEFADRMMDGQFLISQPAVQKAQDTPHEQRQSPKELKLQMEQSMSEFKAQQRDYYARWEEWRGVKEEWLDLAMDEDNLSQRAVWSVEACQKQVRAAAQQAINAGIDKAAVRYSAKAIYAALQPQLDSDRFYLLHAAKKVTGFNVDREYPNEDGLHHFEAQNGFGMMRYLEAVQFGERTFEQIAPGAEILEKYKIDSDTFQFKSYYSRSSFTKALAGIKKSASLTCDFKQLVSAAANMHNFEQTVQVEKLTPQSLPKDGWVNISDHLKEYALPYVDEEQRYHEQYKMPANTDYRLYETFHQPDNKIPTEPSFEISFSQETRPKKLLNFLRPEREISRLQSELKILTNNTNAMRDFVNLLDKSILEMKGEIKQMRELATQATREIANGKHFNDWLRLNLQPELKALGLDPEKATSHDLIKTLSQNVMAPPQAMEEALEM